MHRGLPRHVDADLVASLPILGYGCLEDPDRRHGLRVVASVDLVGQGRQD
jgi:hypothetical protein